MPSDIVPLQSMVSCAGTYNIASERRILPSRCIDKNINPKHLIFVAFSIAAFIGHISSRLRQEVYQDAVRTCSSDHSAVVQSLSRKIVYLAFVGKRMVIRIHIPHTMLLAKLYHDV